MSDTPTAMKMETSEQEVPKTSEQEVPKTSEQEVPLDLSVLCDHPTVPRDQCDTRTDDVQSGSSDDGAPSDGGSSSEDTTQKSSGLVCDEESTRMSTSPIPSGSASPLSSGSETEQSLSSKSTLSTDSPNSLASFASSDGEHSEGNASTPGNPWQRCIEGLRLLSNAGVSGPMDLRTKGRAADDSRPARPHPYSMAAILGPADGRRANRSNTVDDRKVNSPTTAKSPDKVEGAPLHYSSDILRMSAWYNAVAMSNYCAYPTTSAAAMSSYCAYPTNSAAAISSYSAYPTSMSPVVWPQKARAAVKVVSWCHCCNTFLSNIYEANAHQFNHYTNKDKCELQNETFTRYGYVTHHVTIDDNTVQCSICKKSRTVYLFAKHQQSHEGHSCDICGREYSSASSLNDHYNTHNGDTPYTCTYCQKQFSCKKARSQHQRCHANEGRFRCGFCGSSFNKKYTLHVHERLHTGDNPYACDVTGCGKAYPQKVQLQNHVLKHHPVGDA